MPGVTLAALVLLCGVYALVDGGIFNVIAAWAIVIGVLEIVAAVRLRKEIENEWWLGLSGLLSIVFGVFLMLAPGAGALALMLWIGAYALLVGVFLVALGVRLRGRRAAARGARSPRAACGGPGDGPGGWRRASSLRCPWSAGPPASTPVRHLEAP